MNAKELTVLMVEPGKHPKVTKIKDDLDSLQKAVSSRTHPFATISIHFGRPRRPSVARAIK